MCTKHRKSLFGTKHTGKKITYKLEKLSCNNEFLIWYLLDVLMTLCVFHWNACTIVLTAFFSFNYSFTIVFTFHIIHVLFD